MIQMVARQASGIWDKVIATVIAAALTGGVFGLFKMNDSVARLEERVASWTGLYEKRFDGIEASHNRKFDQIDRAINDLRRRP